MKTTFTGSETDEILRVGVEHSGLISVDPSKLDFSLKPLRDGSGQSELSCSTKEASDSPQHTATAQSEESTGSDDSDTGDDSGDSDSSGTSETASIFGT